MSQTQISSTNLPLPVQQNFGETKRSDLWWLQPVLVFLGLGAFVVYSTWRAFQGAWYAHESLLSPFYSPLIFVMDPVNAGAEAASHAWLSRDNVLVRWLPAFVSPAFLILWAPGGFRFTCYYYRGAYYKAFWADPVQCGVGEPRKKYLGERFFPLIFQNIHRYFLYVAIIFIGILTYDAIVAMFWTPDGAAEGGSKAFGIHVGTIVMILNVVFLGAYTFGCHSLRHIVGGGLNRLAGKPVRKKSYDCVSCLNRKHMMWAWISLFWVGFTDFYVYMCAMGIWHDYSIIGA